MLAKGETLQAFQVPADAVRQETSGRQEKIRAQPWLTFLKIPLRSGQLTVVQRRKKPPVVVEHRGHPEDLHGRRVEDHAEAAIMPVNV